jgi:delta(3,5)-delta(2,4)-dienoyl-CoA isomerase
MWLNLSKIFTKLSDDANVRAILLTGAGERAFTAGLDVQAASTSGALSQSTPTSDVARLAFATRKHSTSFPQFTSPFYLNLFTPLIPSPPQSADHTHLTFVPVLEFQSCISTLEKCPKPVIAVLHGISYGLALDMCLAADIRFSTTTTQFSVKEVDIGIAADIGTLSRLPHSVGNHSWVKEIALSARIFGSDEALQHGLVSRVYKDKEEAVKEALGLAGVIASKSPVAVVGTKEIINYSRERTVAEGLNYTAVWNAAMLQTQDVKDAMMSGLKKTKPVFSKL